MQSNRKKPEAEKNTEMVSSCFILKTLLQLEPRKEFGLLGLDTYTREIHALQRAQIACEQDMVVKPNSSSSLYKTTYTTREEFPKELEKFTEEQAKSSRFGRS